MGCLVVRRAEVDGRVVDVRIDGDRIVAVTAAAEGPGGGAAIPPGADVVEAGGGALLPGLHDHHIHLLALAAAERSVRVGPGDVGGVEGFRRALAGADAALA